MMPPTTTSSATTAATTTDQDGDTTVLSVHPDILRIHILTLLDGPALASISSTSPHLRDLCSDENLWKAICNSSWPSTTDPIVQKAITTFSSGHRSFFSDSFPALHRHAPRSRSKSTPLPLTCELVSAVDIRYGDNLIYSKVVSTETLSGWFLCSPFRLDLLDPKEMVPTSVKLEEDEDSCMARLEENMRLSWILIDPAKKRAANMSSLRPVAVRRHWLTREIEIKYATVIESDTKVVKCGVITVTCEGKEGGELHVREVSMQIEDVEGKIANGKGSLVILNEAMEGQGRRRRKGEEKERYEMFLGLKREWKKRIERRERKLDMVCIAIGVTLFLASLYFILSR